MGRVWAMGTREKRILVVEDDDAIRALLLTILQRRGFKVDTSSNGADAIKRLSDCIYSVILLDMMMPVMSGYEFLADLEKRRTEQHPLVIEKNHAVDAIAQTLDCI